MPLVPPKHVVFTQDAPTFARCREISLAVGKHVILSGGVVGWHRKQLVITNEDPNTRLYIVNGPDGNVDPATTTEKGMTIGIGESITLFTNADVVLKNLSASETVTSIQILEIFYQ